MCLFTCVWPHHDKTHQPARVSCLVAAIHFIIFHHKRFLLGPRTPTSILNPCYHFPNPPLSHVRFHPAIDLCPRLVQARFFVPLRTSLVVCRQLLIHMESNSCFWGFFLIYIIVILDMLVVYYCGNVSLVVTSSSSCAVAPSGGCTPPLGHHRGQRASVHMKRVSARVRAWSASADLFTPWTVT